MLISSRGKHRGQTVIIALAILFLLVLLGSIFVTMVTDSMGFLLFLGLATAVGLTG